MGDTKDFPKRYDPKEAEPRIRELWEKQKIFRFDPKSKKKIYSIDTPPPTVSGKLHVGHVMHYSQFEFVARFKRMQGFNVFFPMGFDNNGLATEMLTEKEMGVQAEDMSREEFRKIVNEVSTKMEKYYEDIWRKVGMSLDWTLLYRTIDKRIQKMSQLSFLDLYKKGRVYRKEAPIIWCPKCHMALAQVEMEDKELDSHLCYIEFETDTRKKITIATTRPELMPACVGVSVHADDKRYKKFIGKKAKLPIFDRWVKIIPDEETKMEYGTGAVYYCTYGGIECVEWMARHPEIEPIIIMGKDGRFLKGAGKYAGMKSEEARKAIITDMEKLGCLVKKEPLRHAVNVHERCGTPVEYITTEEWFIRYLDLKKELLKAGKQMNWYPKHMKVRYDNWVNGLKWDWCISRQRYYGVPIPVWYCKKCGKEIVAEEKELPVDPLFDKVKKKCKCGGEAEPEKDIFDTWQTSSLTPLINAHWREKENLMDKIFPMDLRPQAHDIITFWLFNTTVKSLLHEGKAPFKNIMISGHGLDPKGKKMSKSKGNVVEPLGVMEKYSADALRFWAASARLGEDLPYQEKDVATGQKTITKLWNASRFASLHIDSKKPKKLKVIDRWLLSKLMRIVNICTDKFEEYEYSHTKMHAEIFFWKDFCDNYLEMAKYRLYNGDDESAKYTLYFSLLTILKLFAPIMPFITEEIYQILFKKEKDKSIHVSSWPKYDEKLIDKEAEELGEIAVSLVAGLRQYKQSKQMALNTEIGKITLDYSKGMKEKIKKVIDDIRGTMKVKEVVFGKLESSDEEVVEIIPYGKATEVGKMKIE